MRLNWQPRRTTCCSQGKKGLTDSYHSVKRKHKHSYSPLTAVLIKGANRVRQMLFSQAVWVMVPSCPDKVGLMGRMFHSEKNTGKAGDYCVIIPNSSQMQMTVWRVEDRLQTDWGRAWGTVSTHISFNADCLLLFTVGEETHWKFVWPIYLVVALKLKRRLRCCSFNFLRKNNNYNMSIKIALYCSFCKTSWFQNSWFMFQTHSLSQNK